MVGFVIMRDSDSDILAMVIAGVASVVGGLLYRLCHGTMSFSELFVLVWVFVTSRGAIPILDDEYFGVLFGIGCDVAMSDVVC